MEPKTLSEQVVQNMLNAMPYWNAKLVRPFRETLNGEMSLETYFCLETVRHYGSLTMTELSQYLKVTKQQATKLVEKLDSFQFVERIPDPSDRRLIRIRLTQTAAEYLDQYYTKNQSFLCGLEEQLSAEQIHALNQALTVLLDILPALI